MSNPYWEFPQGSWEAKPDADSPAVARGELAEETGLRAGKDRAGNLPHQVAERHLGDELIGRMPS
jgi:8-oxo-dGTP pyrophosphatase MutT (NUDIX family)